MDECKELLQKIVDELTAIKEGQVYVLAELIQIRTALGGS